MVWVVDGTGSIRSEDREDILYVLGSIDDKV